MGITPRRDLEGREMSIYLSSRGKLVEYSKKWKSVERTVLHKETKYFHIERSRMLLGFVWR